MTVAGLEKEFDDWTGVVNARLDVIEALLLLSLRKEERRALVERFHQRWTEGPPSKSRHAPAMRSAAQRLKRALTVAESLKKDLRYPSHQGQ